MPGKKTNYSGMTVEKSFADKLKNTPEAEFLRFTDNGEGTFTVQAKLPETGRRNGRNFRIRENVNFFMHGIAKACFDENGNIDFDRVDKIYKEVNNSLIFDRVPDDFAGLCGIPEERRDEFLFFVQSCAPTLRILCSSFCFEMDGLRNYQYNLSNRYADPALASVRPELVDDSYEDYKNLIGHYRQMAVGKPSETDAVRFAGDCRSFAELNQDLLFFVNNYRDSLGLKSVRAEKHVIDMKQTVPEDPEKGVYRKFDYHVCFTLKPELDGETCVLSLETTAPPTGKLLFCPGEARTGVGLYDSMSELDEFHCSDGTVRLRDFEKFYQCKNIRGKQSGEITKVIPPVTYELAKKVDAAFAETNAEKTPEQLEAEFNAYSQLAEEERARSADIDALAAEAAARREGADYDSTRLINKEKLKVFARMYGELAGNDEEFRKILDDIKTYADMNVTAVSGDYSAEKEAYEKIFAELSEYYEALDAKQSGTDDYDPELPENRKRYTAAADLLYYFESRRNGDLIFDPDKLEKGAVHIDAAAFKITDGLGRGQKSFVDRSDAPLFPHDPSPDDIKQGYLGDCYLLAGLSALAEKAPDKIRECIKDNGDGTVTVRFFRNEVDEHTKELTGKMQPVYVTVDKKVPVETGAHTCLWAQMIERAYVASGLHLANNDYSGPVPPLSELKKEYARLSKLLPEERPSHEECPWLIDTNGELHEFSPCYSDIVAGNPGNFLKTLTGERTESVYTELKNTNRAPMDVKPYFAPSYMLGRVMLDALGDKASQSDADSVFNKTVFDSQLNSMFVFRSLFPDKEVPMQGEYFNSTATDETRGAKELGGMLFGQIAEMGGDLNRVSREEMKTILSACVNNIARALGDPDVPGLSRALKAGAERVKRYFTPETVERIKDVLIPALTRHIDSAANLVAEPDKYSGEYSGDMKHIYDSISEALSSGKAVTAGTSGDTDKRKINGVFGDHGYSVLGVEEKTLEGMPENKKLRFVVMRNPHGRTGRKYYVENGQVKCKEDPAPGGVFRMELHDFCKEYANYEIISFNAAKGKTSAQRDKNDTTRLLTGNVMSKYSRALSSVLKTLDVTGKDSAAYGKLYKSLDFLIRDNGLAKMKNRSLGECAGSVQIKDLIYCCDKYEEHCRTHIKSDARRANRLMQVKNLRDIVSAMKNNLADPKEILAERFADKIMSANSWYAGLNQAERENQINSLRTSEQYRFTERNYDFASLSALTKKKSPEVGRIWLEMCNKLEASNRAAAGAAQEKIKLSAPVLPCKNGEAPAVQNGKM